jgi:hypothetical protein
MLKVMELSATAEAISARGTSEMKSLLSGQGERAGDAEPEPEENHERGGLETE